MNTLQIQTDLANKYNYKPLSVELSKQYRKLYENKIPDFLDIFGGTGSLFTTEGTLITDGYERIVIGDYGAFIEFNETQSNRQDYHVPKKERFRLHTNIPKYEWWSIDDGSEIKIYKQKRGVAYADYLPNKYYVSVYDVTNKKNEGEN